MDRRSLSARDGRARHALLLAVASGLTGEMVKRYCSLYCMGYKGKEIGSILSSSRYYKINSSIRKKLGLSPNETNLDIYLRNLMASVKPDPAR